jgi:DNA-directed RNA polymerase subunit RPC12/RpoP
MPGTTDYVCPMCNHEWSLPDPEQLRHDETCPHCGEPEVPPS